MNKFIKSAFYFILILIPSYFLLIFLVGNYFPDRFKGNLITFSGKNNILYKKFKEVEKVQNIDLLFIGSSRCYRGFDVRIFREIGIKSYNLGSSSQTPIQSETLLKKYLPKLKPKLVVFEVSPLIFSLDGFESTLDIISNQDNDIETIKMALKYKDVKIVNSLIYSFMNFKFGNLNKTIPNYEKDAGEYVNGGYVEKHDTFKDSLVSNKIKYSINKKQIIAFNQIISLLAKSKIKLLLVQAPVTKELYHSCLNNDDFNNMMHIKGNYIDFNGRVILNDSLHFFDNDHLNQKGVEIFNRELIPFLGFR